MIIMIYGTKQTNAPVWDINDLKPGDKVFIARPSTIGWKSFRYNTYQEYTVEKITPKKTKVYLTNDVLRANDMSPVEVQPNKTQLYKESEQLALENRIANCAQTCSHLIYKIDSTKDKLSAMSDDEILELHGYLSSALELLEKQ